MHVRITIIPIWDVKVGPCHLLTRSIRDSETSIDFVQGPPGSRRERVKGVIWSTQEKITWGLWAISPPKCKKEPLKIAIDCNVKACSMLQI